MDETREEQQEEVVPEGKKEEVNGDKNEEEVVEEKNEEQELFTETETLRLELKEELIKVIEDLVYELKYSEKPMGGLLTESDEISGDDLAENNIKIVCEAFFQTAVNSIKLEDIIIAENEKNANREKQDEEEGEDKEEDAGEEGKAGGENELTQEGKDSTTEKQLEEIKEVAENEIIENEQLGDQTNEEQNKDSTEDNNGEAGEKKEEEELKDDEVSKENALFVENITNILTELHQEELIEKINNWKNVVIQWRKLQMVREREEERKRQAEERLLLLEEEEDEEEDLQPQRTPSPPPIPYTQVLTECSGTLLDCLRLDKNLLSQLEQAEVLSEDMILDIKCRPNRHDKVNRLIELLLRLGPKSLRNFIEALKQNEDHYFLAKVLSFRTFT